MDKDSSSLNIFSRKVFRGLKNVTYLTLGNILSQVIAFVGFIFMARLLGPGNYGLFVTATAFVSMFSILTFVGLDKVMVREGSREPGRMKRNLERVVGMKNLCALISILLSVTFAYLSSYSTELLLYIAIYSFILLYQSLNSLVNTIFQASEKMKYIAMVDVLNKTMFVGVGLTLLFLGYGVLSLIIVNVVSSFVSLAVGYGISKRIVIFNPMARVRIDRRLMKYGLVFSLLTFMGFLTKRVDLVMLSFFTSAEKVGIYGVSYKLAEIGLTLRNIVTMAFFPIVIKKMKKGPVAGRQLVRLSLMFLFALFALALVGYVIADDLVLFLFGEEYAVSGGILRILIFYLAFWWATIPFTTMAQAVYKEKLILYVKIVMAVLNIILNYVLFMIFGIYGIAYSTLLVFSIGGLILSIMIYRVLKREDYIT